jgi:hypothetical protein
MSISRSNQLTIGAAICAATIAALFFHAPPIPVAIGVIAAVLFLMMRKQRQ